MVLFSLLACGLTTPPAGVPYCAQLAELPSAPDGCRAAFVVVTQGAAPCEIQGVCDAAGRVYEAEAAERIPGRQVRCSVRYDVLTGTGRWLFEQRDAALRGPVVCMAEGGDWLAVEFVGFSARPGRQVTAAYGQGTADVVLGEPRFDEPCALAVDALANDWPDAPEREQAPPLLPPEDTLYKPAPLD